MTNKEAIILLKNCIRMFENGKDKTAEKALVYLEQHIEALNMGIYALENERPQGRWIPVSERLPEGMGKCLVTTRRKMDNKEAIRRILDHKRVHSLNEPRAVLINEALDLAIKALENERPQGEWKVYGRQGGIPISDYCSNCKYEMMWYRTKYNFCPNCGADMRGGAE